MRNKNLIPISALLFLFWIILSGKMEPFYLISGLIISIVISWLTCGAHDDNKKTSIWKPRTLLKTSFYLLWLMKSMILAAIHVTKLILNPKMPINPALIRYPVQLKHEGQRVLYANSITLTPGTIAVDLTETEIWVHQLDSASAGDIVSGEMERRIKGILGS